MKKFRCLSEAEAINFLEQKIDLFGTQMALANEIGISAAYLSQILSGQRKLCGKTLAYLKLEPLTITVYIEG